MIKKYVYHERCNNISITLSGASGNAMRYNFTHGNTYTNKYPELTIRNRYAQDLLDNHELVKSGKVVCISSVAEPSDVVEETPTSDTPAEHKLIEEDSVRTNADLVNFVNTVDGRTEKNAFTTPARALKWASEHYYKFPNYNPD